ncbi:MAG: nucleotidyltransferase family protein [Candidatus Omnitrophota bacterium]
MNKANELIRLLSFGDIDLSRRERIIHLAGERFDWDYLVAAASREGVACVIYDRLNKSGLRDIVPASVLAGLGSVYYTHSAQNTLLLEEFKSVIPVLNDARVPVILLKGLFLADSVYGNIALRPVRDLDILVRRRDVLKTVSALGSIGYAPIANVEERLEDRFAYSVTLAKQGVGIDAGASIDLHWHILNASWLIGLRSEKCDVERFWDGAEFATVSGIKARVLSPEHLLISLAVNAFTHCYQRLILIVDIERVLARYGGAISVDSVSREADRCGLGNVIDHTLNNILPAARSGKYRGRPGTFIFKREYRPFRPCLMYILTCRGIIAKFRAFLEIGKVITYVFFSRLKAKNT